MTKRSNIAMSLLSIFLYFYYSTLWAGSTSSDNNISSMSGSYIVSNSSIPQIISSKTASGGNVCTLTTGTSVSDGFNTASAKWRTPNTAGTITNGGYTYDIQRTNIPGIGVIARLEATFVESQVQSANYVMSSIYQTIINSANTTGSESIFLGNQYWAIVTIPGESIIPGNYSLGTNETMIDVWCQAIDSANDTHGGGYLTGTVEIKAPTCTLDSSVSSVMTMDLGSFQWVDIRNLSVGSNFGSVSKSLSMQCQAGAWPKLTVTDKNDNTNNTTIISLTNPSASSTAQGVGVQVFINNQSAAQQLATSINISDAQLTKDTSVEMPLQFKYIKTSDTLSTGEANAIVDLTFTYD